jgi:CheY-like chemotaxis protein
LPLAIPKILVVADPADQRELVAQLRGAGAPFTEAVIAAGDGDDSTLRQFTDLRPQVVVVTATLAAGDTRSLVGAMREAAAPKGVFIVLLGDEKGPVKNALDALDFGCDRFVARPVAVKALRFAVMSGLGATISAVKPSSVAAAAASYQPVDALRTTEPMPSVRTTDLIAAVRVTEQIPVAVRVTDQMPAVWGTDPAHEDGSGDVLSSSDPPRASSPALLARVTAPMGAARVTSPMAAVDAAVDAVAPIDSASVRTTPVRAHTAPLAEQRARWEALADRLGTDEGLGDDDDVDIAVISSRIPTGEIETGVEIAGKPVRHGTHLPEPMTYDDLSVDGPGDDDDAIALSDDEVDDLSIDEPAERPAVAEGPLPEGDSEVIELPQAWRTGRHRVDGVDGVDGVDAEPLIVGEAAAGGDSVAEDLTPPPPMSPWTPGSTDVPVAPLREPTLVLSDAVSEARSKPSSVPPPEELHLDERHDSSDQAGAWGASSAVPPQEDEDEVLSDVAAGVDEDLSIDITRAPAPPPPPAEPTPPTGGDFARELRRKMSAMAERLFRGADLPAAPVAIGPGHDHHTEIDLRGLVDDPQIAGGAGPEPYDLVGGGATFVGVEDLVTNAQPTETRGTAEAGDIQRGVSDAAALIARMFTADFTGRLVFRRGTTEMVIHVENGRPVFASSNLARDRMGELLLREGKITAEQLSRCRDLVRDTGRRMGEILVERGFLKRRELLPAVRRHVEDIIYSLFAWDTGEYRIVAGDGASAERIRLSRHPAGMVLEGVRRKLDRATLERLLGPPTAVVEAGDRDKLAAIIGVTDLSPEERAAVAAFDGTADLAHVARVTSADILNVYQLAWGLHLLGLATLRRRAGDDDGDAPALVGESDLAIDRERVRARHALVLDADYFALLGVRRDASGFEIKRAYEAARRDFAADTFPAELRKELTTELEDIAQVLDEAYRVLRDDVLRSKYVSHLRDFGEAAS